MDLASFLADVDTQPWADLRHAYGSAADVPGHLRALAGESEEAASEAISALYGSILHQGSVYEATARAVPCLARLAGAGCRTEDLLVLLGGIAEGGADDGDSDEAACRAAVVGELALILTTVDAEAPGLRRAAVWAAAMTGAAERVLPVLHRRWNAETDPLVRAELLGAMAHLDPAGTAAAATAAIGVDEPGEVRIAALLACVDGGQTWGSAHHGAMLSLLPVNGLVEDRLDLERNEPLQYVVEELLRRDTDADRDSAYTLLDAALRSAVPEAREEALWAAETACLYSRSAPERLSGAGEALIADPADAPSAYSLLAKLGGRAAAAAPALARIAAGEGDPADRALEALVAVDPDRAAPLLARDLERRPRALRAACGFLFAGAAGASFPYDPELLDAIRTRLAAADGPHADEAVRLVSLLGAWGSRASAALPELLAVLPLCPGAAPKALAAVCPPEHREATAEALTAAARTGPEEGRLAAATAVRELTGETGPLRAAVAARLTPGGPAVREAASLAAGLGPEAAGLVPALRSALRDRAGDRTIPQLDADVEIAAALWRITGDPEEAVPVLAGVLAETEPMWLRWTFGRAARAAAGIGGAARTLLPALEGLLIEPMQIPSAVLALHAIAPESLDGPRTAGLLLDAAEQDADAETALEALVVLGPAALTEDGRRRLTALAEQDLRVRASGLESGTAPADERLREQARAVARTLAGA
ncbi:hypothetical protein [Streptomyces sp. NBC_00893]|uniref:hypothetical protein n=1 Tax=Streptomyces sp. NBC_00893 TaxID=2975862 RepID=UPI00225A13F3|nr:hypothetical protein [Streptomyces sp. NBC_00893]MCX4844265.1 hypothetical protein [Streptomyces sp. NBC_00893]